MAWKILAENEDVMLITDRALKHGSRTYFNEDQQIVFLGSNVYPGDGMTANARLSVLACLAHELAHAQRYKNGYRRPVTMPDVLIDEAETSLHASFHPVLNPIDREDLIEDARDRLIHWLSLKEEAIDES
jgi:hypothetical protein